MDDRSSAASGQLTFWDHLDVLRGTLIRIVVAMAACGVVAFVCKQQLFALILAPSKSDFLVYRWLGAPPFHLRLMNVGLTEQFMVHMKAALYVGFLAASPYILYLLYSFLAPALYRREKHYAVRIVGGGYAMFMVGIAVNYFVIFPLTLRFLGTYQVSEAVESMLSLQSYVDTLVMMSLMFGVLFEIPVISWLLALFGLLRSEWMQRYWRQALVIILVVAAVITPTGDVFTLTIVSLPIWLLYELSIYIVKRTE